MRAVNCSTGGRELYSFSLELGLTTSHVPSHLSPPQKKQNVGIRAQFCCNPVADMEELVGSLMPRRQLFVAEWHSGLRPNHNHSCTSEVLFLCFMVVFAGAGICWYYTCKWKFSASVLSVSEPFSRHFTGHYEIFQSLLKA